MHHHPGPLHSSTPAAPRHDAGYALTSIDLAARAAKRESAGPAIASVWAVRRTPTGPAAGSDRAGGPDRVAGDVGPRSLERRDGAAGSVTQPLDLPDCGRRLAEVEGERRCRFPRDIVPELPIGELLGEWLKVRALPSIRE
jgi:hypothetical protein